MKTYGATYQPVVQGGLRDSRSTGGTPTQQPRRPLLNDRRSTR